jgi:hypothetical protein
MGHLKATGTRDKSLAVAVLDSIGTFNKLTTGKCSKVAEKAALKHPVEAAWRDRYGRRAG